MPTQREIDTALKAIERARRRDGLREAPAWQGQLTRTDYQPRRGYTVDELAARARALGFTPLPDCPKCNKERPDFDGPYCDCPTGQSWQRTHRELIEREQAQIDAVRQEALEKRFGVMEVPVRYRGKGPHTIPSHLVPGKEVAIAAIKAWVEGKSKKPGLLLMGKPGVGKSVLGWWAVPQREEVRIWLTWPDLYRSIQGSYKTGNSLDCLKRASTVPLLFLDDLGDPDLRGLETKDRRDILFVILNARLRDWLPTLITSNLSGNELVAQFGDRIVSRLLELCHDITMGGKDLRRAMR